ncbi:hypothetical protein [Salinisphaera sp. G21_0]|uniref:hypothetical protein n=1 Tax=Salinisphaera sp. G21_0 TaxID=2821094 RepID=UPI001ADD37E0|nr:hypothetical protein [Salinisphaera sp. G21_0]MBO9481200.1 hypothetical protein [Salinisphaera sp. G21_0]
MHIESAKVPLSLSTQPSTEQPALAAQSVTQFTAESFDNLPGANELATRLNTINKNMLDSLNAEEIGQMCHNFTSAFNLDNVLVEEASQLKAIKILLTLTNCYDNNSIKAFANSKLQETPDNHDACQDLKDKANKDNTQENKIVLPPEYQGKSDKFSFWRDKLLNSFIDSQFSEANFTQIEKQQVHDALRMAKMQVAGNTGIGNFEAPIPYEKFDREKVSQLTGHLIYPRQELCADKLAKEIMALQEQLFDSDSGLINMLGNNEDITKLLQGNQQHHLKQLLARQGADNRSTLTNEVALLVSFVARNPKLAGEFAELGINPGNLTHLAKAHSILNHARATENKQPSNETAENNQLSNKTVAKGLKQSDEFTRKFFDSETANNPDYEAVPVFAKIALWVASSNQSG